METVIIKKDNKIENKWTWVKMFKDTPISIVKEDGEEIYSAALGKHLITERTWTTEENVEIWLEKPTMAGEFPWKEIVVIGIITKE